MSETVEVTDKKEEYIQLNENLRNYHHHRFLQLTLWLAITASLMSAVFDKSYAVPNNGKLILKLVGIIASFIFWIMDLRMVDHWRHFWKRLREIEPELGFRMWTDRPKRRWLGSTNATWLLYGVVIVFWIIVLFWPSLFESVTAICV